MQVSIFDREIARIDKQISVSEDSGDIFEFEPVPLEVFVRDRKYLGLPPLSSRQQEAVEFATQIYYEGTLEELKWKKVRYVKELCLLWGKGCQSADSKLLSLDTGEIKSIKEWAEEKKHLWLKSMSDPEYGKPSIVNMKTSIPWKVKKDKVYKVTLADGSELKINKTHKFFKYRHSGGWRVKGDWFELQNLKVGDKIATSVYEYNTEKEADKNLMWLFGVLIGDGSLSGEEDKASLCVIVHKDKEDLLKKLKTVVGGFDCHLHFAGHTGWSEDTNIWRINGDGSTAKNSNSLRAECKRLGLLGKIAYNKFVPKEIYTYTKECRVEFLRGLLETDGWVSSYKIFDQRVTEIGYGSASKELIFGIKRLLASLGVRCRIRTKKANSEHGVHYVLKVRDRFNGMKLLGCLGWEDKAEWSSVKGQRDSNNDIVFEKIVSIEYVGEEDVYDLEVEGTHNYVDADCFINHNSGKDFISRVIHLRIAYLLLCLRNPQAYFYHPEHQVGIEPIELLNTASTKEQAANVFFSPLRKYVSQSPFFKNRSEVLTREIRFDKGVKLYSGHSEAEAMEGMNLIAVVLDEIAAFKTEEEVADLKRMRLRKNIPQSAASLYDFANTSVTTRFPKVGKVILLSFPRFRGDFIMTRYAAGLRDRNVYVSKGATFEINPTKKKSDFADERKKNPQLYEARIECNPGIAEDAFFKNEAAIRRSFKTEFECPVDRHTNRYKNWFICRDTFPRYGHVDLAKNRCRAAFSFVHAYDVEQRTVETEDGTKIVIDLPLIKQDVIMYFEAASGGDIDFEEIQDRILEFKDRGFRIELLTFDGYNSIQMMQTLDKKGINVEEQSVDRTREAYETWQDCMYEGRFISYYNKILVEKEIPFLIDDKGRKIIHRKDGNKDGSDAVAGAVNNCIKAEPWGSVNVWVA